MSADAKKLKSEIEDTLLRNLSILREEDPDTKTISVWTVEALMRACAGNLAQILAERLTDAPCRALCDEPHHSIDPIAQLAGAA